MYFFDITPKTFGLAKDFRPATRSTISSVELWWKISSVRGPSGWDEVIISTNDDAFDLPPTKHSFRAPTTTVLKSEAWPRPTPTPRT